MELFDTYTKSLVDLPLPPGPVRMYFCGPTVYARAHVGNARPFVIGMWMRSWLKVTGYDVTFVHNITDVNDKIYDAAPGRERRARRSRRPSGTSRTRATSGSACRTRCRRCPQNVPVIVEFIEELIEQRARLRGRGRRLLPRRELPRVRAALRPATRPGRGAGAEPAQGGPARLRALEGEEGGRGHVVELAVGPRPAGLAHRVLGDGREAARPGVRDPRRRARPRLPPPRERARAVARARPRRSPRSGRTTGSSASPARRCRSRTATSSTLREALDQWGRETLLLFFLSAALAQADRLLGGDDGAGRRRGPRRSATRSRSRRRSRS